jgi:hypothetical protein
VKACTKRFRGNARLRRGPLSGRPAGWSGAAPRPARGHQCLQADILAGLAPAGRKRRQSARCSTRRDQHEAPVKPGFSTASAPCQPGSVTLRQGPVQPPGVPRGQGQVAHAPSLQETRRGARRHRTGWPDHGRDQYRARGRAPHRTARGWRSSPRRSTPTGLACALMTRVARPRSSRTCNCDAATATPPMASRSAGSSG